MRSVLQRLALLIVTLAFAGCSTIKDWVAPVEIDPPAELQDIQARMEARELWSRDVGENELRLHLMPLYQDGRLYLANQEGEVAALDAQSGKAIWSVETGMRVSGGPGVGQGMVLVGSLDAEVIALSEADGSQLWRAPVSSEVLSTPVAALDRVVVSTIDGKVLGLDPANGTELWRFEREMPTLTLRGSASPVVEGSNVICGLAGGRLVSLDIRTGDLVWETAVTVPSGRSELERLADIDGDPLVLDGIAFVSTYQGVIAAIGARTGTLLWRREFSSYQGMGADRANLYAADSNGEVWSISLDNGSAGWRQDALLNRRLSRVAVISDLVAVGDFEGYVHFLAADNGELVGRTRVGSDPISDAVLLAGDILFVQGEGGELAALKIAPAAQ